MKTNTSKTQTTQQTSGQILLQKRSPPTKQAQQNPETSRRRGQEATSASIPQAFGLRGFFGLWLLSNIYIYICLFIYVVFFLIAIIIFLIISFSIILIITSIIISIIIIMIILILTLLFILCFSFGGAQDASDVRGLGPKV